MKKLNHKTKMRYFLIVFSLTPLLLFSQTRLFIKKSYAYYSITAKNLSPKGGTDEIITLDTGNIVSLSETTIEKDTSILVFIETTTQNIKWSTAQQGNLFFSITPLLQQSPLKPGFVNGAGAITISAAKGHFLYALQLVKKTQKVMKSRWIITAPLVLKGNFAGKNIVLKTASLKEIIVLPPS
jgi:hypothetical protein